MQQESLVLDRPIAPDIDDADVIAQPRTRMAGCRFKECPVCLVQHEEQIHDATLSVREWFRGEVTKSFNVVFYE
jgi:hypothetical protein